MNNHYVYLHKDPETEEVVYVGKGLNGRAWDVTRSRGQHRLHQEWMLTLAGKGFLPSDWVVILERSLGEAQAFALEKNYLHTHGRVRFNRQSGETQHMSKLTDLEAKQIFKLAWEGKELHKDIALRYGVVRNVVSVIKHKRQWKATLAGETHENYQAK